MRPIRSGAALVALLALAACGGGGPGGNKNAAGGANDGEDKKEAAPIPVEVATLTRGDVFAAYAGTASLEALQEATVVAKVGGEVREIMAEEGDVVREGDVLAQLDGDRLRLQLEQSRANMAKLERDYRRNIELHEKGIVAAGAFENIKYELDALKAAYELAKLEYDYTTIRAPISGVISERMIKVGNTIEPSTPTYRLTALEPLVAYLFVPEREFGKIQPGQRVELFIDALPSRRFVADVTRISPTVDPATGTFKVTIEVNDDEDMLKPGMFGRFSIVYDDQRDQLLVPRNAVLETEAGDSVFVVDDGVAKRTTITTGYEWQQNVAVLDGLHDDQRVVVVGQAALKDGAKVRVIGDPEPEGEPDDAVEPPVTAAAGDT
jgi:membrane fusion protein (multidrug efflux system)